MSIRDIIANKKLERPEFLICDDLIKEDLEIIEGFTDYYATYSKKEFSIEEKDLFFSLYAPYIREPYKFDWYIFRDYFSLFFPDGAFIIGTFQKLDIELILKTYLDFQKPKNLREYSILCHFINHIFLFFPKEYEDKILNLLIEERKKFLDNKTPICYNL
jgi:hypothetical protein